MSNVSMIGSESSSCSSSASALARLVSFLSLRSSFRMRCCSFMFVCGDAKEGEGCWPSPSFCLLLAEVVADGVTHPAEVVIAPCYKEDDGAEEACEDKDEPTELAEVVEERHVGKCMWSHQECQVFHGTISKFFSHDTTDTPARNKNSRTARHSYASSTK